MTEFDLGKVVGADGRGIESVELVSTVGKEKTYRITYTDEDYYEFTVKDGEDSASAIVTAWESTLSDEKVPSEKLTKTSLDGKASVVHSHISADVSDLEDTIGDDIDGFTDTLTELLNDLN